MLNEIFKGFGLDKDITLMDIEIFRIISYYRNISSFLEVSHEITII